MGVGLLPPQEGMIYLLETASADPPEAPPPLTKNLVFRVLFSLPANNAGEGDETGKVSAVEKAAYDPGVDVFFQENAWMDGPACMAWANNSFLRSIKGEEGVVPMEQSILFADNLHAQTTDEFKKFLYGECNTLLRLLPPKLTDELQPVDAGYGRLLKVEDGNELDEFLGHEENLCLWETNKLSAGARRILFTRFIARAVA
ncbi:unnamed protein product [Ectocarpus sp. CCAP 1310/34]|nr:unnamed protein product [Ectocarpus sp. CCAP 1310/34]